MRYLTLVFVVACYRPSPPSGIPCGAASACPSGLSCDNGFCGGGGPGTDAAGDDAPVVDIDAPPNCTTFATQLDTCVVPSPGMSLTMSVDFTYDTSTHVLTDENDTVIPVTHRTAAGLAGPIDLIVVDNFTINTTSTLRVVGSAPFGVLSFGDITIRGDVDASSGGAGARSTNTCGTAAGGNGTTDVDGSSGGAGGAFHGKGGAGGVGDSNGVPVAGPTASVPTALPTGPLGGCPGGKGGGDTVGGPGGPGGGALYFVAHGTVSIDGTIDAGGAGGVHGDPLSGAGGGGGSGGMIVIEAATANVAGELAANGGGGGGGSDDVVGNEGLNGSDGTTSTVRANGGTGAPVTEGGTGGKGGAGTGLDGLTSGSAPDNGGGGGGGGCGFIGISAGTTSTGNATISPAASTWPPP